MKINRLGSTTTHQTIVSSIILVGAISLAVLTYVAFNKKPEKQDDLRQDPLVEFVLVESYNDALAINVTGVTIPFREITLAAEVSGAITKKAKECREGTFVDADTPLLWIDAKKYDLKKKRLDAEVKEAEARLAKVETEKKTAEAILETTKKDFERQNKEYEKRVELSQSNAISESELIQSERAKLAAENAQQTQQGRVDGLVEDIKVQKQLIELKKFQLEEADYDLKKAEIKAPAKGVVISDDVQEDDFVTVGQKLLMFEDTSAAEIKIDLRADQLQMILENKTTQTSSNQYELPKLAAIIRYEANDTIYQWVGELDRYDGLGLDQTTRTAPCLITVSNTLSGVPTKASTGQPDNTKPKRRLVRGMYVQVELTLKVTTSEQSELMRIPESSLQPGNKVWIYVPGEENEKGTLSKRVVNVVSRETKNSKNWVVVKTIEKSGPNLVKLGDRIITKPIPQPIDGMPLRGRMEKQTKVDDAETEESNEEGGNGIQDLKTSAESSSFEKVGRVESPGTGGVR